MMFIGRNPDKTIYGAWTVRQWDGQEELPDDHSDVMAFRNRAIPDRRALIAQRLAAANTIAEIKQILSDFL